MIFETEAPLQKARRDEAVGQIEDRVLIEDTLKTYMLAVDRGDGAALRGVFSADGRLRSQYQEYSVDEFVSFVQEMKSQVHVTLHLLSNTLVSVKGNEARSTSYFYAIHRVPAGKDTIPFGKFDHDTDVIMAGRYEDHLCRGDRGWQIVDRFSTVDWQHWANAQDAPSVQLFHGA